MTQDFDPDSTGIDDPNEILEDNNADVFDALRDLITNRYTGRLYHTVRRAYLSWLRPTATQLREETYPYTAEAFWNHWWYNAESNDEHSIERNGANQLQSEIHYRATEAAMLLACHRHDVDIGGTILDVGTGAGHWIKFWLELGADDVRACDISDRAIAVIQREYQVDSDVTVYRADVGEDLKLADGSVDLLSAVGVLFHLTHEPRFETALKEVERVLADDGVALVTGAAGWVSRNRQFQNRKNSQPVEVFKRLRSRREWRRRCANAGLEVVEIIDAPDWCDVDSPENRVLVLRSE